MFKVVVKVEVGCKGVTCFYFEGSGLCALFHRCVSVCPSWVRTGPVCPPLDPRPTGSTPCRSRGSEGGEAAETATPWGVTAARTPSAGSGRSREVSLPAQQGSSDTGWVPFFCQNISFRLCRHPLSLTCQRLLCSETGPPVWRRPLLCQPGEAGGGRVRLCLQGHQQVQRDPHTCLRMSEPRPEAGSSQRRGSVPAVFTSCRVSDIFHLF